MNKLLFLITYCCLMVACLDMQGSELPFDIKKNTYISNSTGISIGFWPNYGKHDLVYKEFGRRGIERSGFYGWNSYELSPGIYDWGMQFSFYKRAHLFGNDVIGCANISFSPRVSGKLTIPSFYPDSIVDPVTRSAAKKYLYALTQEMLTQCGSVQLSIDYETSYNYGFGSNSDAENAKKQAISHAEEWGSWYVEAADTMRKAAADLGMSDRLKLIPIMNGDPRQQTIFKRGTVANQWLLDVVAASDILGFDTYQSGECVNTDPSNILQVTQYWIDNYSCGKPVFMCETGFSSVLSQDPQAVVKVAKYFGTEADQQIFFRNLLDSIALKSKPRGSFNNQFRGGCIWCITDNTLKQSNDYEYSFGIYRADFSPKPAAATVKEKVSAIEQNDELRPSIQTSSETLTPNWQLGIPIKFTSGTAHESLLLSVHDFRQGTNCVLQIKLKNPGAVLLTVNNDAHLQDVNVGNYFEFDLSKHLLEGTNEIKLFFTGEVFPFEQVVESLRFDYKEGTSLPDPILHLPMDGDDVDEVIRDISGKKNNAGKALNNIPSKYQDVDRGWVRKYANNEDVMVTGSALGSIFGGNNPKTICFWMKITEDQKETTEQKFLYGQEGNPVTKKYSLSLNNKSLSWIYLDEVTGSETFTSEPVSGSVKEWHHYAISIDRNTEGSNSFRMYIDGMAQTLSSTKGTSYYACRINSPSQVMKLGTALNAYVSDFRIYPEALNTIQLQQVINQNASSRLSDTSKIPGLKCYIASNRLFIECPENQQLKLEIFDVTSLLVQSATINTTSQSFDLPEKNSLCIVVVRDLKTGNIYSQKIIY